MAKANNKKNIAKTLEMLEGAMNDKEEMAVVITDHVRVIKGEPVDLVAGIMSVLEKIKNENVLGKMAVMALCSSLMEDEEEISDEDKAKACLSILESIIGKIGD